MIRPKRCPYCGEEMDHASFNLKPWDYVCTQCKRIWRFDSIGSWHLMNESAETVVGEKEIKYIYECQNCYQTEDITDIYPAKGLVISCTLCGRQHPANRKTVKKHLCNCKI